MDGTVISWQSKRRSKIVWKVWQSHEKSSNNDYLKGLVELNLSNWNHLDKSAYDIANAFAYDVYKRVIIIKLEEN